MHEPRGHGADETAFVFDPDREGHERGTPCYSPDGNGTIFIRRVFAIRSYAWTAGQKGFNLRNRRPCF